MRKKAWVIIAVCVVLVTTLGTGLFLWSTQQQRLPITAGLGIQPIFDPTPVSDPFADLTIPYLRTRSYISNVSGLQKISENANYTSYLANYDSNGLKINGQLTQPKGDVPKGGWPAIIFIHGYIPPQQYQTLVNYNAYVDYLARNGFVVFKIDLRGHDDSEGDPGGAYYSSDYVIDALNAYAALQKTNFVNPEKIGLWGHSMAGNVVFRSFAAKPEIPAIVIWAGAVYSYTDFGKYGISDNSYQPRPSTSPTTRKREALFAAHGQFDPADSFWKQVVPTNYLGDLQGAIQVHHAVDDNVVDIAYSRDVMKLLDGTSITHELYEYQSGGHNITGSSFTLAMQKTVEFFKKHLFTN